MSPFPETFPLPLYPGRDTAVFLWEVTLRRTDSFAFCAVRVLCDRETPKSRS